MGASKFSCFHIQVFFEDEGSEFTTVSAFTTGSASVSTLSGCSEAVASTVSTSTLTGSESFKTGTSLFLIHIHAVKPKWATERKQKSMHKCHNYSSWKYLSVESNSVAGRLELLTLSIGTPPFSWLLDSDIDSWGNIRTLENRIRSQCNEVKLNGAFKSHYLIMQQT